MPSDIETIARQNLSAAVQPAVDPDAFEPDTDLTDYGLTSLQKVLFLTRLCEDLAVDLVHLTERDVAEMRTLHDVVDTLSRYAGKAS
ncbi:acyl carrier protein [Streptomyces sp. NBC_00083]|uniref:acyl carrier protein n=1 Tax=Streptomyces sp. NBC_00083 TaxID=2975647 RepID=UPI00224CD537|nr:acyl carrier protein [Streptomyces sp. NBC_00083]MCX5386209.1 acyl carrier protein [Streptomyces sp. NBC_00083]